MKGDLYFVYGTLRKGARAEKIMDKGFEYLGPAVTTGTMYTFNGGYPVLSEKNLAGEIRFPIAGDLFRRTDDDPTVERNLDAYEMIGTTPSPNDIYEKVSKIVWSPFCGTVLAKCYMLKNIERFRNRKPGDGFAQVVGGDWLKFDHEDYIRSLDDSLERIDPDDDEDDRCDEELEAEVEIEVEAESDGIEDVLAPDIGGGS